MARKTRLFARVNEEPSLRYLIPRPLNFSPRTGAGDETRTRDVLLGKEVLYH